jgi:hypothetical protein
MHSGADFPNDILEIVKIAVGKPRLKRQSVDILFFINFKTSKRKFKIINYEKQDY